jgi:sigma-B regulation protein RsbU (phosphoserine phosphatase)
MTRPDPSGQSRGVSLRVLGPLLIAGPVLLAVMVMTALAWVQGQRSAEALAAEVADRAAARIEGRLVELVTLPARVNGIMAALVTEGYLDRDDLAGWRPLLRRQLIAYDDLGYVTFATPDGRVVWVIRYQDASGEFFELALSDRTGRPGIVETRLAPDGSLTDVSRTNPTFDPRERPWYTAAIDRDGPGFSDIFSWQAEGGSPVRGLGYNEPVRDGSGRLVGVLDTGLALDDVSRFLRGLDLGEGVAFIIDGQGNLVGKGTGEAAATRDGRQVPVAEATDPRVRAAASVLAQGESFARVDAGPLGRSRVDVNDFDGGAGLPWRIVTVLPESDFMDEVNAARRFTVLSGLTLVGVSALLGLTLGRRAIRPILDVERQVSRIGRGDLETPVTGRGAREIVSLGESLDAMRVSLVDGLRLKKGIEVAMEVQQNLLPHEPPRVPGLDLAGQSVYCDETGGDYFDFIELAATDDEPPGLVVALGDVMGHGIAAALLMTTARAALRSRAREPGSTADLLTHVNELLVPDTGGTKFMTMALVVIDPQARTLRWASAGHDAPLLYHPIDDRFEEPEGGSVPLGVLEGADYDEYALGPLAPGTIVLLGTDGIWEAADAAGEQWGKTRLEDVIRLHADEPADRIGKAVHAAVDAFAGGRQVDDVTLVVIKLAPAGTPAVST